MKEYEKPELEAILVSGTDIVCDSNMNGCESPDAEGCETDNGGGDIDFGDLSGTANLN